ncbi:ABC transporter ATP-binding protein [Pseudonocardia zijingensis]|uniref:ABC transporter ATP-binding protein n=1 Tax=Pseudonocardia zijingensis TaxID=153376 RepID=A0ABN1PZ86_9PSEU
MIDTAGAASPRTDRDAGDSALLDVRGLSIDLVGDEQQRGLVEDVSFQVGRRRSVALIGESGCGKSLTAFALLGLLSRATRVSGGSALFEGVDLLTAAPQQLARIRGGPIGAIFQDPMTSLDPTMKVGDQIAESRRLHLGESRKTARKHAERLLDQVGIANAPERARSYPHELSGGMQQRVMIASAIACDCKLLIADEPTTALDVTIQAQILELLADLQRGLGLAVLLVTHDLGVVADFCDDIVVMYAGHVVERNSVDEAFARPRHPYTKALLGAVPEGREARAKLPTIPGRVPPAGSFPEGCRFQPRCEFAVAACGEPQREVEIEPGRHTRCGRVAHDLLQLEARGGTHDESSART